MKSKLTIGISILILFSYSCKRTDGEKYLAENKQLEQTLLLTQQIFLTYTDYLKSSTDKKKLKTAKDLLLTLKQLETLNYENHTLGLDAEFHFDRIDNLNEVYFSSQKFGIAWTVEIDSFLNIVNVNQNIIRRDELFKNR